MQVTSITITNVLGIASAEICTSRPAILLAGKNGAGKSSILEAVRQALTGKPARVELKKDLHHLLNGDAKKGLASVEFSDGRRATVTLPDGTITQEGVFSEYLALCASPETFAQLDEKQRRSTMFGLMGVKITPATVKDRLLARGLSAERVDRVAPLLSAGFDAAAKEAAGNAKDARAVWKSITGEQYGSVKAASWRSAAEPPTVTPEMISAAQDRLAQAERDAEAAAVHLGEITARQKIVETDAHRIEALKKQIGDRERLQAKLQHDEAELARVSALLAEAEAKAEGGLVEAHHECPDCGALLQLKAGRLIPYTLPEKTPDREALAELPTLRQAKALMQSAVDNTRQQIKRSEGAEAEIESLRLAIDKAPQADAVGTAERALASARTARSEADRELGRLMQAVRAAEAAAQATQKAEAAHQDAMAWDAIAEALAPAGIPAEFLSDALAPFNALLEGEAVSSEWRPVGISDDMEIFYGGTPYRLCSESERWRADAMIGAAIARQSKVNFLMLDRLDVLDVAGRSQALQWIADLGWTGVGVVAASTLKGLPSGLPPEIEPVWIEDGVASVRAAA